MPETRTKLKHLLEDLRDNYPFPIEEAIITELVANSLDSGCSEIAIRVEPEQDRLTFVDNGEGMSWEGFVQYHDIASTAKVRGKGIGFAGVGAKLALLVCKEILTESKRRGVSHCSRWWLEDDYRAPWENMGSLGLVPGEKGTGVRLHFRNRAAGALLSDACIREVIQKHFYPLLDGEFAVVLDFLYPRGIAIRVNGEPVVLPEMTREDSRYFPVRAGQRRRLLGMGFLLKAADDLPEDLCGLAISTYGKVIKRGWEWLGMAPKSPRKLSGVVEVPEMVECLTPNKSEFLRDPTSLQKFYKCRKVIQEAVAGALEILGEMGQAEPARDKGLEKIEKEIDRVVGDMLPEFPELAPLFGRKHSSAEVKAILPAGNGPLATDLEPGSDSATGDKGGAGEGEGLEGAIDGPMDGSHLEPKDDGSEKAKEHVSRRKRPGLMIRYDEDTGGDTMAWLRGSTLWINARHPAYERVQNTPAVTLYIAFAVASELSSKIEEGKAPLQFIERFMAAWGGAA